MQSQDWSEGGSPEGADVPNAKSAAPSGPLCFFLRVEKEEAALKPINKGTVDKGDEGNSFRLRSVEGDLTKPPPSGREAFGFFDGVGLARVSGSFAAG